MREFLASKNVPENKNQALSHAWQQAERAQRMSVKMGYYWGRVDAEEAMKKLEEMESFFVGFS